MYLKLLLLLVFINTISINNTFAKLKIPVGERIVITKVYDLPNTDGFLIEEGHYIDIATMYSHYSIGNILPIWTVTEPKLVGYDEIDHTYFEISEEKMNNIIVEHKLNKSNLLTIPFYDKYGGKIIICLIAILLFFGFLPNKKENQNNKTLN